MIDLAQFGTASLAPTERSCYLFAVAGKGEETRTMILAHAVDIASVDGLEAVTIGRLAEASGLSKSGLFSHFASKETLQIELLRSAAQRFVEAVVQPALTLARGRPRLEGLFEYWLTWRERCQIPGGCIFLAASMEFDDRPGPVREFVASTQTDWLATLARAFEIGQDEGHFSRDLPPTRAAFELYGLMTAAHLYSKLLARADAAELAMASFQEFLARNQSDDATH